MKISEEIKNKVFLLLDKPEELSKKLQEVCNFLKAKVPHYHWVGFYFKNGNKKELKLGPFAGKPTEHTIIPYGKGICGQVAISNKNFVVPDVTAQDNYISCGIEVKSEIVVPIFKNGKNIGQIDIDSHNTNPFSKEDEYFLEEISKRVTTIL